MSGETVAVAIKRLSDAFARVGIDNARLDARILVGRALGVSAGETALHADRVLDDGSAQRLTSWADRRLAREPIGRILGEREFWRLTFELVPDTLEPRPDSEALVAAVLEANKNRAPRILDLGTGTGCLLIALLKEIPEARGLGIDQAPGAVACAARNAARAGVEARAEFIRSDWFEHVARTFDVVVSNPPYLSTADMATLAPEVSFDPAAALIAGEDGCDAYRAILSRLRPFVRGGTVIALEIGANQCEAVSSIASSHGFKIAAIKRDLAGHSRCLLLMP